ncbi:AbrB/MazE/SpoVT family DNA-binding domain-containing protein [Natronorubrum texcoconense]|uniref:Looped-hinge helix DNA binding domain-containing protein, AbrB family n=1 Tax=Natronorubrum texcoconense TaxID=1095776 RepID=A0A1G8VPE3_9EURY|nr:AbrB/MazE/SpoVT family DNA-binding domain-containing protein [Natronorubrum texcoconense]SDJ67882.1 looped-hinge helix DNA binding domain-containing protein, AbrB family [Natronorubrum texcoconense]
MSSNTNGPGEERVVSVTEKGQATIPKRLREKHGIPAPGRVKFVENENGEIVVRAVGSMREFRGLERDGEEERPATAVLRDERERDRQRGEAVVEQFAEDVE